MIIALILFFAAFLPGIWVIYRARPVWFNMKYLLVFAGAYIFSITIVHILPEVFEGSEQPRMAALFVLAGFFMQIFLDYLTSGVEHGHEHLHHHGHSGASPLLLMIGLCLHALMDGAILVHPVEGHPVHDLSHTYGLLLGIVLHKIPAALALMAVLMTVYRDRRALMAMLLLFSISSPVGYVFSEYLNQSSLLGRQGFLLVFALVSGNFLHISTTIFFESSPEHSFHRKKILISLLGALLAVLTELGHH
jgi:zinc and cadmium transporter